MSKRIHGVFCLETDWWNDLNRTSTVKPVLKLLSQRPGAHIPYVHRDVSTTEEFRHYCEKWTQRRNLPYPILYLSFHGEPGCLRVGDSRRSGSTISLDDLATILGLGLRGRIVHFGSCETLATDRRNIQRFLRSTGAVAATGFKKSVDWLYSSVFDVLLFDSLVGASMTVQGMRRVKREVTTEHAGMCRKLDFRMEIRDA